MKEKKKKKKILFRPVSKQIFYLNSISCSFPYRATITDNYFSSFLLLFSLFPLLFSSFFQTWCLWRFITKYNQVSHIMINQRILVVIIRPFSRFVARESNTTTRLQISVASTRKSVSSYRMPVRQYWHVSYETV